MSFHIEATVDQAGRIVLEHLPFRPGDKVEIVIRAELAATQSRDLKHSVLRYDNPFDPVATDEWELQP